MDKERARTIAETQQELTHLRKALGDHERQSKQALDEHSTSISKLQYSLQWHVTLIGVLFTLIIGLGIYKVLLEPNPIGKDLGERLAALDTEAINALNERASAVLDLLILDVTERMTEAVRQVSFTGDHNKNNYYIAQTLAQVRALEGITKDAGDFATLREVANCFAKIVADNKYGDLRTDLIEAAKDLNAVAIDTNRNIRLRVLAYALLGTAHTMIRYGEYDAEAALAFSRAQFLSQEAGLHLGIIYNGVGAQAIFRAEELYKAGSHREAREQMAVAREAFARHNEVDRTLLSSYREINNTNYIETVKLRWAIAEEKVDAETLGTEPEVFFADLEVRLGRAETLAPTLGVPSALSTTGEFWSLKGNYLSNLLHDNLSAAKCFELSKAKILQSIKAGICRTRGSAQSGKTMLEGMESLRPMLECGENRQLIERAIDSYFDSRAE